MMTYIYCAIIELETRVYREKRGGTYNEILS